MSVDPTYDTRADLAAEMWDGLARIRVDFAVRGLEGQVDKWIAGEGHELDLWAPGGSVASIVDLMADCGLVVLDGPNKLRPNHVRFVTLRTDPPAVVEWLFGDLAVGPLTVLPEELIDLSHHRWDGVALAVDLVPRRMMLGKKPTSDQVRAAAAIWERSAVSKRSLAEGELRRLLGRSLAGQLTDLLEDPGLGGVGNLTRRVRRRVGLRAAPRWGVRLAWRGLRRVVSPGTSVDGRRSIGTLAVLIGTDGTGKTTTTTALTQLLNRLGATVDVRYFGRTRGNLPGLAALRRRLEAADPATRGGGPRTEPERFLVVRRMASWYYALELAARFWFSIAPRLALGRIVILDRFVYDLSVMPSGSQAAARLARRLVRKPDLLFMLDAPALEIHNRKPERFVEQIETRQAVFRSLLESVDVRLARGTIWTSREGGTDLRRIAAAITCASMRHNVGGDFVRRSVNRLLSPHDLSES